jgi:hypothetical protein
MKITSVNKSILLVTEEQRQFLKVCEFVNLLKEEFALKSPMSGVSDTVEDIDEIGDKSVDIDGGMRVIKNATMDNIDEFEVEEIQNAVKTYMFLQGLLSKKLDIVKEMVAYSNIIKKHHAARADKSGPIPFGRHGVGQA